MGNFLVKFLLFGWVVDLIKGKKDCYFPLPVLNGREPQVTSASKWENKSRPEHNGDDWMYPRLPSDTTPLGDGEGTRNKKWVVPKGTKALAIRDGIVRKEQFGKIDTGYRLYVQHEDGYKSGYFHLAEILVKPGQFVKAGQPVGVVGDNPAAVDPRHLHFEVCEGHRYKPINPSRYLKKHEAVFKRS